MIKIEKVDVYGWEAAIRGMRNPMNSWDKSDSDLDAECFRCDICGKSDYLCRLYKCVMLGKNDLKTMKTLSKAGSDHAKYLRYIDVTCDITCHHAWWAEFDTYKVGSVRNSCSKMHKIHVKEFTKDDFSHEGIDELFPIFPKANRALLTVIDVLEELRIKFNETQDKRYWRAIIELLPMGYNLKATLHLNYQVLKSMYFARRNHKLDEWHDFCRWCESLPYFKEICIEPMKGEKDGQ